jgi:hypothetical protein
VIPGSKHEHRFAPNQKHGLRVMKRALKVLGSRAIDQRTTVAKALKAWRAEIVADLGGIENITTAKLALLEEAVLTKFVLSSVNAWLMAQPSLVSGRNRGVLPAVLHRNQLVATLKGLLEALGLERQARQVPSLHEYLAAKATPVSETNEPAADEQAGASGTMAATPERPSDKTTTPEGDPEPENAPDGLPDTRRPAP